MPGKNLGNIKKKSTKSTKKIPYADSIKKADEILKRNGIEIIEDIPEEPKEKKQEQEKKDPPKKSKPTKKDTNNLLTPEEYFWLLRMKWAGCNMYGVNRKETLEKLKKLVEWTV